MADHSLEYVGHSTFIWNAHDKVFLFDPYFGDIRFRGKPRVVPASEKPDWIDKVNIIFVSHEHETHCEKPSIEEIVNRTGAMVVAPKPALSSINIDAAKKVDVRVGDDFNLEGVHVRVVKAVHPQSEYPVGYIVSYAGISVYYAGDTYAFHEMHQITADYSLIPIGGMFTMDVLGASTACRMLRTKYVVPMHYNTHELIRQDASDLNTGRAKLLVMKPGERIEMRQ